jgi:hypothetical protein
MHMKPAITLSPKVRAALGIGETRALTPKQIAWCRDNIPSFADAQDVALRVRAETAKSRADMQPVRLFERSER